MQGTGDTCLKFLLIQIVETIKNLNNYQNLQCSSVPTKPACQNEHAVSTILDSNLSSSEISHKVTLSQLTGYPEVSMKALRS